MKKIYATGAISMIADKRGFVFTALQTELEDTEKSVIAYKKHDFDSGATELITRTAFLLTKFGLDYEKYISQIEDYINCKTVLLPSGELFVAHPDGTAVIFNKAYKPKWSGNIKYKGFGPACVVNDGTALWCSYPENNAVIRYKSEFMRSDLRISTDNVVNEPYGLAVVNRSLYITSAISGEINSVNLDNFNFEKINSFDEPVYEFIKIDSNEVVLTKSGIYRL